MHFYMCVCTYTYTYTYRYTSTHTHTSTIPDIVLGPGVLLIANRTDTVFVLMQEEADG